MAMFNPAHPGELIRETIDGIIQEAVSPEMALNCNRF